MNRVAGNAGTLSWRLLCVCLIVFSCHAVAEFSEAPNEKYSPPGTLTQETLISFATSFSSQQGEKVPQISTSTEPGFAPFLQLAKNLGARTWESSLSDVLTDNSIGRAAVLRDIADNKFHLLLGVDILQREAYLVGEYIQPQWMALDDIEQLFQPDCLAIEFSLVPMPDPLWHATAGRMLVGELDWRPGQEREITLFNRSGYPVYLIGKEFSCICGDVELPQEPILPGGFCRLTLNIDATKKPEGRFELVMNLHTDHESQATFPFIFLGAIRKSVRIEPNFHSLGGVRISTEPITLSSYVDFGESYEGGLTPAVSNSQAVRIEDVEKVAPGRFKVTSKLDPAKLNHVHNGRFFERASLESESENVKRVDIGAVGTLIPTLQVFPAALYVEAGGAEEAAAEVRVAHLPGAVIEPVLPEGLRLLHSEAVSKTETLFRFAGQAPKTGLQEWTIVLRDADGSEWSLPWIVRVR